MEQKNIVITGGNIGIGLETAKGLYADGHVIIFGSRNEQRNIEAADIIVKSAPNSKGKVTSFKLDLSKRASIEAFAKEVQGQFGHIDILINNAGMIMNERQVNEWGVEMTMAVNHFGHFLLTYLLFPLVAKAKEGRIINVSS
jgi:NAD(P)-dependent dehydrogenase (short-subunit alcohol dehydrogenase family)